MQRSLTRPDLMAQQLTHTLHLPAWFTDLNVAGTYPVPEARIRLALELARRNVAEGTGGPFAAVLIDRETGQLVAAGVNRVVPEGLSVAHAEIVTLVAGQRELGVHDLGSHNLVLTVSCEPCAMCYGAVLWSGVRALEFSASGADADAVGFDEGDKPADWADSCRRRGIEVNGPLLRAEGRAVLEEYSQQGGLIYNPHRSDGAAG